jgi:hypothetical protein
MGKRSIFLLGMAALAGPALATNYSQTSSSELCVVYAVALIRGNEQNPALVSELRGRGETCAPSETYIQAAEARIRMLEYQAHRQEVGRLNAEARTQAERDQRIRAAGQAYLMLQQQRDAERKANVQRMTTTRCMPNGIGGVDCTTN